MKEALELLLKIEFNNYDGKIKENQEELIHEAIKLLEQPTSSSNMPELLDQCQPVAKLLNAALEVNPIPEDLKEAIEAFENITCPVAWSIEDIKSLDESVDDGLAKQILEKFTNKYDCGNDWEVLNNILENILES